ncbi:2,3-bisphosphoglycerate-independent phosphoglycerate mutase [Aquabacterium sp. OR-4]|uniref:2,3-bisphosphoglycerate-independent phosphoglycerate mutase n=1 Tax=Aquabacterium sp. OR-4 TaxID=2978127 RepID=UPI0021B3D887|nr:2,3-bisphosphoglycerate-independent phosphoglycerate mutase [Aquabacterium sp. OR-4]MDT7834434.1 2,3-bisphosphoglycerate-independent phosphoglycerate mutase [Aquabacterium sp. OR-4]
MKLSPAQAPARVVFLVLDGVGDGPGDAFDAVALARTPNLDQLRREALVTAIRAHGTAVGLPSDGDIGNSEVGHNILGAGRVFPQGASSVETAIASGAIWQGCWRDVVGSVQASGGTLHLLGLLSDGNVHAHERHLFAMLDRAALEGLKRVRVHVLLDGRDVMDKTAHVHLERLEQHLAALRQAHGIDACIASGGGRMAITMDRYGADWPMVARGWQTHVLGQAPVFASALAALQAARAATADLSDQYVPAFVVADAQGQACGTVHDGDAVVLFNFRGDRAIEITRAFTEGAGFTEFERQRVPQVFFAGMMLYDGDAGIPAHFLVAPAAVSDTVSECLADSGVRQFACAETQKFGHITYFWNGNRSGKFNDATETYLEIPSDRVSFDQRPWMKSAETADALLEAIADPGYQFVRANFAGGDMVGHTGKLEAAILAVEAVDLAVGRLMQAAQAQQLCLIVTADHGNAEDMVERDGKGQPLKDAAGQPMGRTSHTRSLVPFIVRDYSGRAWQLAEVAQPGLANAAATIVTLLGLQVPAHFEPSLVRPAG